MLSTSEKVSSTAQTARIHHPDRLGTGAISAPAIDEYTQNSTLPFGTGIAGETGTSNQTFTSYDRSAGTGLDYAVNRTYSQGQSRFTQVDPLGVASASLGDPQSNNLYGYVQNMPIDFVDPSGLNMAGPNTRYTNLDPMGVAYYVDGMLTDAWHAWAIINGGSGWIIGSSVEGITIINSWEQRRNPSNEQWEYRNFQQSIHIWATGIGVGEDQGDCIPGIPCVRDMIREAIEKRPAVEECLKGALERAQAAKAELIRVFPFDGKWATKVSTAAGITGAATGALSGPAFKLGFLIGAIAGGGVAASDRVIDRVSGSFAIAHQWMRAVEKCGNFSFGKRVPKRYQYIL